MLIPRTEMHPFCILKRPFDIVFNFVSDYGYNLERSPHKSVFYKYAYISAHRKVPDLISSAFDVKFWEYIEGLPSKARRPLQRNKEIPTSHTN